MPATAFFAPDQDTEVVSSPRLAQRPGQVMGHTETGPLELKVITDRADFDALEAEWNGLFARAGRSHQLFLSFNWLWHWCNHYLVPDRTTRLSIVIARRDGRLVMVWPLVTERSRGLTMLSWMGDPVSQYGDVLIDDAPDADCPPARGLGVHPGQFACRRRSPAQGARRCSARAAPCGARRPGDGSPRSPLSRSRQRQGLRRLRAALLRRHAA